MTINELMEVAAGTVSDQMVFIHDYNGLRSLGFIDAEDYKRYRPDYHGEAEVKHIRAVGGYLSIDAFMDLGERGIFDILDDMNDLIDEFFDYTDGCKGRG